MKDPAEAQAAHFLASEDTPYEGLERSAQNEIFDARKRSEKRRRQAAATSYLEPYWTTAQLLAWIAFRDPTLIRKSWRAAILYETSSDHSALREPDPQSCLLRALQEGRIQAIDQSGDFVKRAAWAHSNVQSLPTTRFDRKALLKVWPLQDPKSSAARPSEEDAKK